MYQMFAAFIFKYQSILLTLIIGVVIVCYTIIFREWRLMISDPARYLQKHGIAAELTIPAYIHEVRLAASRKKVNDALAVIRLGAKVASEEIARTEQALNEERLRREQEHVAILKLLNMRLTVDPEQVAHVLATNKGDIVFTARVLEEAEKQHQIDMGIHTVPTNVPYPEAPKISGPWPSPGT